MGGRGNCLPPRREGACDEGKKNNAPYFFRIPVDTAGDPCALTPVFSGAILPPSEKRDLSCAVSEKTDMGCDIMMWIKGGRR